MITVSNLGGPSLVAKALGLAAPTVHGWKLIPEARCPDIERWKNGEVTVEQMRPDKKWRRIPDPAWPHPEGRPLLDVAREVAIPA